MSPHAAAAPVQGSPTLAPAPGATPPKAPPLTGETLLDAVTRSLDDDKAYDVVAIDLRGRSEMGDFMVIASGRSTRQVSAMADHLQQRLKDAWGLVAKAEGKEAGDWVLIDAGDVIVHVFRPEVREFYQLEKMWLPAGSAREGARGTGLAMAPQGPLPRAAGD